MSPGSVGRPDASGRQPAGGALINRAAARRPRYAAEWCSASGVVIAMGAYRDRARVAGNYFATACAVSAVFSPRGGSVGGSQTPTRNHGSPPRNLLVPTAYGLAGKLTNADHKRPTSHPRRWERAWQIFFCLWGFLTDVSRLWHGLCWAVRWRPA